MALEQLIPMNCIPNTAFISFISILVHCIIQYLVDLLLFIQFIFENDKNWIHLIFLFIFQMINLLLLAEFIIRFLRNLLIFENDSFIIIN